MLEVEDGTKYDPDQEMPEEDGCTEADATFKSKNRNFCPPENQVRPLAESVLMMTRGPTQCAISLMTSDPFLNYS